MVIHNEYMKFRPDYFYRGYIEDEYAEKMLQGIPNPNIKLTHARDRHMGIR
jgi:hypothetical protein